MRLRIDENCPVEDVLDFDENGPIVKSWDVNGFIPNPTEKVTLEEALDFNFKSLILDKLPDHKVLLWIRNILNEDAQRIFALPFVIKIGKQPTCYVMKEPHVACNRDCQIAHIKKCSVCQPLICTDFHQIRSKVDPTIIWRITIAGLIELWETQHDAIPSFNNLPLMRRGVPSREGIHRIIFGVGCNSKVETNFSERNAVAAGYHQSRFTVLMRIVTHITDIHGFVDVTPKLFRATGIKFLNLVQNDIRGPIDDLIHEISLILVPILGEVDQELELSEAKCIKEFQTHFYRNRTFQFRYMESAGVVNKTLDTAGLVTLKLIELLHAKDCVKISLCKIYGDIFCNQFVTRNIIKIQSEVSLDEYQVKPSVDSKSPVYPVCYFN